MIDIGPAIRATSEARDLCLSLKRAFLGPRALAHLRAGETEHLSAEELRVGLGLAWATGDVALVRQVIANVDPERLESDPVLATLRDATSQP